MTRVSVNHNAGWLTPEPLPPRAPLAGCGPLACTTFDKHLERAQRLAATAPSSPSSPPASAPPQPPPSSRPTSQSPPASDGPPEDPEPRDERSPPESDSNAEASAAPAKTLQPKESHREGEQDADEPAVDAAAGSAVLTAAAGQGGDGTPTPARIVQEGSDAAGITPDAGKVDPAAVGNRRPVAGQESRANGNRQEPEERILARQDAVATSQVSKATNGGEETADVPAELREDVEASASDARDREQPHRVAAGEQAAILPSKADVPAQGPPSTETPRPQVEAIHSAAGPLSPDPAARGTEDRPGENGVRKREDGRAAKAISPATAGPLQPRTAEENGSPQAAVTNAELETASASGVEAAEGEREPSGGEARGDRPTDAKTADAAMPRDSSTPKTEAAGHKGEPGTPTDEGERARFVQRVARAFESAADRGGHVRLRLHPPELGALRLELTVRNGQMHARLETETEAARNLLLDNLPELRERLASHHIRVERFDVEWRDPAHGGPPQGFGDPGRWQGPPTGRAGRGPEAVSTAPAANPAEDAARRPRPQTSFDVVI